MPASLPAQLSLHTAPEVLSRAAELTASGSLDLSGVAQADSAGISLLLELTRRSGGKLTLKNAPAQVRDLARFFEVEPLLSFQ